MSKHKFGFDYCALRYLNMWLEAEREPYEALSTGDEKAKREALAKFGAGYRIARNLPKKHDEGKEILRFKPVLDIIDKLKPSDVEGESLLPEVERVRNEISVKYGGRGVLSLTTKFLWLKLRSPIIIYDRQARKALGTKNGDLKAFYAKWRDAFAKNESKVEAACNSLSIAHKYTIGTPEDIAKTASEQWFKERVFDIYLWNGGQID